MPILKFCAKLPPLLLNDHLDKSSLNKVISRRILDILFLNFSKIQKHGKSQQILKLKIEILKIHS